MLGFGREITTGQRRDGLLRRMQEANADTMESLIAQWRTYLGRQEAIHALESEELEGRLRDEVDALQGLGLTDDEAFLIALRRVGETDSATRGFAREHFERLWSNPYPTPLAKKKAKDVCRSGSGRWRCWYPISQSATTDGPRVRSLS